MCRNVLTNQSVRGERFKQNVMLPLQCRILPTAHVMLESLSFYVTDPAQVI